MPRLGESVVGYPRGYGWCQCGCLAMTKRLESGSYDKYVADHDSLSAVRETKRLSALIEQTSQSQRLGNPKTQVQPNARGRQFETLGSVSALAPGHAAGAKPKDTGKRQDDRLVNMYADLNSANLQMQSRLECLENEVSFAIKYVKAFWRDNPDASQALVIRLESALTVVRVQDKT